MTKKETKKKRGFGASLTPPAAPEKPKPSAAQEKLVDNADEGRTGPPGIIDLTLVEELTLRTLYYEVEMLRQRVQAEEQTVLKQFRQREDIVAFLSRVLLLDKQFGVELEKLHKQYGTSSKTHVFHVDTKQFKPIVRPAAPPA